jgi:hypothetical protein
VQITLPDMLDESVVGFTVTYWTDPGHKWLLQYAVNSSQPCFSMIKGVRTKIQPAFDANGLFLKCVNCLVSNPVAEAKPTEYPSLDIGIAFRTFKIYANVPISDSSNEQTLGLRDSLEALLTMAGEELL